MKKLKQRISLVLTFLFLISFMPKLVSNVKAETQPTASDVYAVLVGDFVYDQGLGLNWNTANAGTLMKRTAKGIYELTVNFTTPGSYNYKVAFNNQWDNPKALGYGDNNDNKTLDITSTQSVTFRVDYSLGKVYDTVNDPEAFRAAPTAATLVGTLVQAGGTDWDVANAKFDLDYLGNGFYKKTFDLKDGVYNYKVAYDHKWSNGEVGSNVTVNVPSDQKVTFLANYGLGICTDSITDPSINTTVSLIGTIRNAGDNNLNQSINGYEFTKLSTTGKFIYSMFVPKGRYEYKTALNYSWDNAIPGGDNKILDLSTFADADLQTFRGIDGSEVKGKYVVFICDTIEKTLYNSVDNKEEVAEALGLSSKVKSPVVNPNGTVTFNYADKNAASVSLMGAMNGWSGTPMVKDQTTGVWSVTLRLGDNAQNIEYKFLVNGNNWITDPLNTQYSNGNSLLVLPEYTGRKVVLAGTIQSVAGEGTWNPGSDKTRLTYDGNGQYHITIPNVPAGNYEYKIAMGSWDPENYGANGKSYGDNMKLYVPSAQDVTFWYSDDSHYTANSVEYKKLDIALQGTGIPENIKLQDELLTNIFSAKVKLNKGIYSDLKAVVNGKEYSYGTINIADNSKEVTFSYSPAIDMVYSDAADNKIGEGDVVFNSKEAIYKSFYGAVPTDSDITFSLKAKKDTLNAAKLVLITDKGTNIIDMNKNGSFEDGSDKWSLTYNFALTGMNKYYFIVSNGSDVKAYCDDDGYFGAGRITNISDVKAYDLNVYDKNYSTPAWMKNAVVYQIFPDRFFNGDYSNDYSQKFARGSVPYEFPNSWYIPPEDPSIEFKTDEKGNIVRDSNGKPILNPDYKGLIGDGEWSNDMYGGDIKGVQAKLDYLQALGVNVLYFNPVSQSISNHRYDTTDYTKLDPLLGHMEDFVNLANEAKKRNMHVILDGVFNHVSDDSVYFDRYGKYVETGKPIGAYQYWSKVYDLMNTKNLSMQDAEAKVVQDLAAKGITDVHYKDWFKVENRIVDQGLPGERYQYEGWWGYDSMPVIQALNGSEYQVKSWSDEIIDGNNSNTKFWLRQGSSGWRLDVANEVSDETWRHFREAVKSEGDNVIIGEIWDDASRYILGDMYDSVMNYRFRNAVLYFVKGTQDDNKTATNAVTAMNELEKMREQYPKEAFEAMMNLVDSHDTQRVISALDGYQKSAKAVAEQPSAEALAKMKLIPLIQMTYPGAPTIYYGDEVGMSGADDPDNRRGMIWGEGNKDLVEWYAKLANLRNTYPVLRTGDIVPISISSSDKNDVLAYSRNDGENHALIAASRKAQDINGLVLDASLIPDGTVLTNALNPNEKYTVSAGKVVVNVPNQSGIVLVASYKAVSINEAALKDAYDPSCIVKDRVRVTGVSLDKNELKLPVGQSAALKAFIAPENANINTVTWSSSDETVATVKNGVVTATNKTGNAVITVKTDDGGYTAECAVTVVVPVTGVSLNKEYLTIRPGETGVLTATVNPTDATNKGVKWESSNPAVASVDADGKVTGKAIGTAVITVTTLDGSFTAKTNVAVATVPVKSFKFSLNLMVVTMGDTANINYKVNPGNASVKEVAWNSSEPSIGSLIADDNKVNLKTEKVGVTMVTGTTLDGGHSDGCLVVVVPSWKDVFKIKN